MNTDTHTSSATDLLRGVSVCMCTMTIEYVYVCARTNDNIVLISDIRFGGVPRDRSEIMSFLLVPDDIDAPMVV